MIRKWHLKAVVQKTISFLPNGHHINHWFQKHITKGVQLSDVYFYDRLEHAQAHLNAYEQYCGAIEGGTTLELGTGWYPVVPMSLFLKGAAVIHTVDISELTTHAKLMDTLRRLVTSLDDGTLQKYYQPLPARATALRQLYTEAEGLSVKQILERLNIRYTIIDARQLSHLPDGSIDLVHSNNTFEHVYPAILKEILVEFKRVSKSGGLQSHFVDMSDHFAHFDHSINIYNFLKYSPNTWDRIIDNSIQPQNRWRFPQFVALYKEIGLPLTQTEVRPGDLKALDEIPVHKSFKEYTPKELAISHCYLFSKMD